MEEKNETKVEEIVDAVETTKEQPKLDDKVEKLKVKAKEKMKSLKVKEVTDDVTKVNLGGKKEEAVEEVVETTSESVVEEITTEAVEKLDEVVEKTAKVAEKAIAESEATGKPLPENIQSVVDFVDETGGSLEDYVRLNQDYDKMDQDFLLKEYYKNTKPHLNEDEVSFLLEDQFSFDKDSDDDREIKRKKLALKEQVASAKDYLGSLKSKYYKEVKGGGKLSQEQQEAINFYEGWKEEDVANKNFEKDAKSTFMDRTETFFNDKFKGFEYNVGDKKFRFNVNNANELKDTQSDINNFIGKFLDENQMMKDAPGYHKSLFTAMNSDAVAKHFYEQGKADALKQSVANSKNISMEPRQGHGEVKSMDGVKVRVLGSDDGNPTFKFKTKK